MASLWLSHCAIPDFCDTLALPKPFKNFLRTTRSEKSEVCGGLCAVSNDRGCALQSYNRLSATSGEAADVEGFHLQIFLDADLGALAAEAGLFDTAEGSDLGRDQAGVEADHTGFERLTHTP